MRNLNLDQLQTLTRVVELGSFSAAARSLNLTQPAISLQVRELEQRLGVRLVERMGKRAHATAAGKDLIEHAGRMMREAGEAVEHMRRHREGRVGRVRLGANDVFSSYILPRALSAVRAKRPGIEILLSITGTANAIRSVLNNQLDLAVVTLPVADRQLTVVPVYQEPLVAILPPTEFAAAPRLSAEDLARHPLILDLPFAKYARLIRGWFEAGGVEPRPVMESSAFETNKRLVAVGLGASVVPQVSAQGTPGLVVRPLKPKLIWELAIIARRDKPEDAAAALMRDALMALKRQRAA